MKILVCIDGSASSLHAFRHAVQLTQRLAGDRSFGLLNVHSRPSVPFDVKGLSHGMVNDYYERIANEELQAARDYAQSAGVVFEALHRQGHPAEQIAGVAVHDQYDLIVMGTKGRSHFADMMLGSTAQRVASMAQVPVLLVPAQAA